MILSLGLRALKCGKAHCKGTTAEVWNISRVKNSAHGYSTLETERKTQSKLFYNFFWERYRLIKQPSHKCDSHHSSPLCLPQHGGSCAGEAELTWAGEQQVEAGVEQLEPAHVQPRAQQQLQSPMGLQGPSEESLEQQHHGNLDSQRKTGQNEGNAPHNLRAAALLLPWSSQDGSALPEAQRGLGLLSVYVQFTKKAPGFGLNHCYQW